MSMMVSEHSLEQRIEQVALPLARALHVDIVEITCLGKGAGASIRVTIDKVGGLAIADCEQLHRSLSRSLDVLDPIPQSYRLEVSSPGLDRPLKQRNDYERVLQKLIRIHLLKPHQGKSSIVGHLNAVSDAGISLSIRSPSKKAKEPIFQVAWDMIAKGRLEIEF